MSRTYRIKNEKQLIPWTFTYWINWYPEYSKKKCKSMLHRDGQDWLMSTPSWWHHDMHTKPRRAKTRIEIQKVYRLIDYENVEEFPLDKKPHIYYW